MLWVDKYRPITLSKLDYHDGLTQRLADLAHDGDLPHLLVYGPSGAGKFCRLCLNVAKLLLRRLVFFCVYKYLQ